MVGLVLKVKQRGGEVLAPHTGKNAWAYLVAGLVQCDTLTQCVISLLFRLPRMPLFLL